VLAAVLLFFVGHQLRRAVVSIAVVDVFTRRESMERDRAQGNGNIVSNAMNECGSCLATHDLFVQRVAMTRGDGTMG
jgi:hypothetical protein